MCGRVGPSPTSRGPGCPTVSRLSSQVASSLCTASNGRFSIEINHFKYSLIPIDDLHFSTSSLPHKKDITVKFQHSSAVVFDKTGKNGLYNIF